MAQVPRRRGLFAEHDDDDAFDGVGADAVGGEGASAVGQCGVHVCEGGDGRECVRVYVVVSRCAMVCMCVCGCVHVCIGASLYVLLCGVFSPVYVHVSAWAHTHVCVRAVVVAHHYVSAVACA